MKDSNLSLLLFAAGLGTRLRPFTDLNPKPCISMLSIPMGYYLFPYFNHLHFVNKVANTFHLPNQIHHLYSKHDFLFSNEVNFIKGSGGGLQQAQNLLSQNHSHDYSILTCNADEIFFTENTNFLIDAYNTHSTQDNFATLIVTQHPEAGHKFGAIWTEGKKVVSIGKQKPTPNSQPWHFIGLQFLKNQIFNYLKHDIEQNIFYDVLVEHLIDHKVEIYPIECDWYETGNLLDYRDARIQIKNILNDASHPKHNIYKSHYLHLNQFKNSELCDLT